MLKTLVTFASLVAVWAQDPSRRYVPSLYRPEETPKPYEFSYVAEAIGGQSSRQESGDASGRVVGTYTLSDEDGRNRVVKYEADEGGFRAVVETNEPGTKSESPADVSFYSTAVEGPHPPPRSYQPQPPRPQHPTPTPAPQERPTTVVPIYHRRPFYDGRHRTPYFHDRRLPSYLEQPYAPIPQYLHLPLRT